MPTLPLLPTRLRTREAQLVFMAAAIPLAFATWQSLLSNFAIERAGFTGAEMGTLQSLREVPGFLAFTAVFLVIVIREQALALLSLTVLGVGVAVTGAFPSVYGLYITTVVMSVGFHYFETMQQSLQLQWLPVHKAPRAIGRQVAATSLGSIAAFGMVWLLLQRAELSMETVYVVGGGITLALALFMTLAFPRFDAEHAQHKHLVLRKRYWLYYALTFLAGARRQIFVVFAGFLMVERFGFTADKIALLLLANHLLNLWLAPRIGSLVTRFGERRALIFEYAGLIAVFTCYAFVETVWFAASLFVLDHLFFALAIAQKTYFQKIADPADVASTAGVAFTINHIAAVILPVLLGLVWIASPSAVFLTGAGLAALSLLLSCNVPRHPGPGREALIGLVTTGQAKA